MTKNINLYIILYFITVNCNSDEIIINGNTMGTYYKVKIVDSLPENVDKQTVQDNVNKLLEKINIHLSTYINSSEIENFNNRSTTDPYNASDILLEIINKSIEVYNLSDGDFDITINPLYTLWGFNNINIKTDRPDSSTINTYLENIGSDKLYINNKKIIVNNLKVQIDVSAIAKGWAVDKISNLLKNYSLNNYIVDIGGEILVSGYKEKGELWEVGIRSPENNNFDIFSTVNLSDVAIATSGTYLNYLTYNGVNYSHIIDPKSGYPVKNDLISATIIAKDCFLADAIATAVIVKGLDEGLLWINSLPGVEGILITKNIQGSFIKNLSDGFNY